jgi:hypothetical protein
MGNEFLELIETVRSEEASIQRLFGDVGGAGAGIRTMRRDDPRYKRSLVEAAELCAAVYEGRKPMHYLEEAMSTSDFPLLFGDILDRQLLGTYNEWPTNWTAYSRRSSVRDFRSVKRFTVDGSEGVLPKVPQGSEYPETALNEALVNDDLDALRSTPERLGKAARMSEDRFATALFAAATGPNATFFSAGNKNLVAAGAGSALSVTSLQTAFSAIWAQVDTDGNPIFTGQVRLVVPPQLAVVAQNILNATEIRAAAGGGVGTAGDQLISRNWMAGNIVELVVNPWLPIITTTGTIGATAWYLFAEPTVGRPAIEVGFLRGHESPELFLKSPNATRIGGGAVAAEDGDFG